MPKIKPPTVYRTFDATVIYYTHSNYKRRVRMLLDAPDADRACDLAERRIRWDKRRHVARVTYTDAVQVTP